MRIAIDVAQTCSERAGCAWYADTLARTLANYLKPSDLILYHHFGSWINQNTSNGTYITDCEAPIASLGYNEAKLLWNSIESGKIDLPGTPDVVHSSSFMCPKISSVPLIYTVHDITFITHPQYTTTENQEFCKQEFDKALKYASAFLFVSKSSYEDFIELLPSFFKEKQIPYKIAHSISRLSLSQNTIELKTEKSPWLFVGTIEPRKNIDGLLDSYEYYSRVSDNPRPLVIVGSEGWLSEKYHERIKLLERNNKLLYYGYVPDSKLIDLYKSAFALLFPSHYEGFGLPVVEAMNFSLPVISNDIKSIREFANNSATYVNFNNPTEVASEMINLETNQGHYEKLSQQSMMAAQTNRNSEIVKELFSLYRAAIEYKRQL